MKYKGQVIDGPSEEIVVIPRDSGDIIFRLRAVTAEDYGEFDKLCPSPNPPSVMVPGGETSFDVEDSEYKKDVNDWAINKTSWMSLMSLTATKDLEWETVNLADPKTWANYKQELQDSLSDMEVIAIIRAITDANGLNQEKLDEAKKRFLAGTEAEQEKQNSPTSEQ